MSVEEKKVKIRYDRALLDEVLERDSAKLVGDYQKLNRDSKIKFICSCGEEDDKNIRQIYNKTGMFCTKCTLLKKKEKTKKTNLIKYGVEITLQNKEIKEKIKKINLEKYGSENPFQSNKIKEKIKKTNLIKYGVEFPTQNKEIYKKIKQTNLQKYGCEAASQNKIIREKVTQTNLKKFGVKIPTQNKEIYNKIKQTNLEKYGTEQPAQNKEVQDKYKLTCMKKYGVENAAQNKKVKEKAKQTNLEKYGTEHPAQNPEVMERTQKNAKKYKEFKMPSGTIRKVQGYEPFALTTLLQTYTEEQIKTDRKDVPRVDYEVDGKKRYYFPDIFLTHENKIIEVKSTWTYKCKADNVKQKADACRAKGFNFEFWVYNAKGERVEVDGC
jgi:hypothetical protein